MVRARIGPYLPGPNDENEGIYTGDAWELAKDIPAHSIDLIYADPPWNEPALIGLALDIASMTLRPGGHLLLQPGLSNVPAAIKRGDLYGNLSYRSILAIHHQGDIHKDWTNRLFEWWAPLLWYSNGPPKWVSGNLMASLVKNRKSKRRHEWEQGIEVPFYYIHELTEEGAVIMDPFTGSGTVPAACKMLGRQWLAFEKNSVTAGLARTRLQETQPPLIVTNPGQLSLEEAVR